MSYKVLQILDSSIKVADNVDRLNFTGSFGVTISTDGKTATLNLTIPSVDTFSTLTDGTNSAIATGTEAFKFRSANNILSVLVTDNEPVHGDNLLLTVNQGNIDHNAIQNIGTVTHSQLETHITNLEVNRNEQLSVGLISGGIITPTAGIQFDVASGVGYVDISGILTRITWNSVSGLSTIVDGENLVGVNTSGTVYISQTELPSTDIYLGHILTIGNNTSILETFNVPIYSQKIAERLNHFLVDAIGPLNETGSIVTEQLSPNFLKLDISDGIFYSRLNDIAVPATSAFTKIYNTSDNSWVVDISSPNTVDTTKWNNILNPNTSALVNMTVNFWKKDIIFQTSNGTVYYVYAQAEYQTEDQADGSPLPLLPLEQHDDITLLATIVSKNGDTTVANRITDIRSSLERVFYDYAPKSHQHEIGGLTNSSTGLLRGGTVTINTDTAKFDLQAGFGVFVNNTTDPLLPTYKIVSWNAQTAVVVINLTTQPGTYLGIDNTGSLVQSATRFSYEQTRDIIPLAFLFHASNVYIKSVLNNNTTAFDPAARLNDLITAIGIINVSGNTYGYNGTNLKLDKSSGKSFDLGVNFHIDKKVPDIVADTTLTALNFQYVYHNGSGGLVVTPSTDLDTNYYDNLSGTLQAIPTDEWVSIPIFYIPGQNATGTKIMYPQKTFATKELAIAGGTPDPDFVYDPNLVDNASIRTYCIVKQNSTDLSDSTRAIFIQAGKFVGSTGGGSTGSVGSGAPVDASYIVTVADPTLTNEKVIGTDFFVTNSHVATNAGIVESKLSLNYPTHSNVNDPTSTQKAALGGSFGTPSGTNVYVTDTDPRNTNARTPTSHLIINDIGIGPEHTISGGVNGYVFKVTGPTTAQLMQLNHTELANIGTNTHSAIDTFIASRGMINGLASLDSNTKVPVIQLSDVLAVTDLSSYSSTSGTGSTAILSTITLPSNGQVLGFDGTNWINQSLPSQLSDSGANGIVVRTALNTTIARTLIQPAAGLVINNADGVSGNPSFVLADDLEALEALNGVGLYTRTTTNTWAARTITGTTNQITLTNGNGVSNNPTISIASNPVLPGTASVTLPSGSTAQRPATPTAGMYRFNTSTLSAEVYTGSSWVTTTSAGTVTSVAATQPSSGLTISGSPIVSNGTFVFALANDLAALEGLTSTGIAVRSATDTWTARTITGTANQISVTNGDGIANNPLLSLVANTVIPGTGAIQIPSGTTAQRPISPIVGDIRFNTTANVYEAWNGTNWISFASSAIGSGVKEIIAGQLQQLSGTSLTPYDNTPPLITEGSEFFSQIITTQTDNGRVVIWFSSIVALSSSSRVATIALYRDSTLIGVTTVSSPSTNSPVTTTFIVADSPGVAGSYTYSGRIGMSAAATWYIGGWTSAANYGGAANTNNQYVLMRLE